MLRSRALESAKDGVVLYLGVKFKHTFADALTTTLYDRLHNNMLLANLPVLISKRENKIKIETNNVIRTVCHLRLSL